MARRTGITLATTLLLMLLVGGSALSLAHPAARSADRMTDGTTGADAAITVYVTASPQLGNAPLNVWFDGIATGGTPPYAYTWYFNDGTTWTGNGTANTTHVYTSPRTYNPQLVATDSRGEQGFSPLLLIRVVQRDQLTARISANPLCGSPPLTVAFNSFVVGGVMPYNYKWSFGDGGTASAPQVTHLYANLGSYFAIVEVADSDSPPTTVKSNDLRIDVSDSCNTLNVFANANPRGGPAPLTVQFNGGAQGGQPPYSFTWDFGDGANAGFVNPQHIYTVPGVYGAVLTVRDSSGATATSQTILIEVQPGSQPLMVFADASPRSGDAPLYVQFKGSVSGGTPPYKYEWDFGDGSPTSGDESPTHTYLSPGTYYPYLHAYDSANNDGVSPRIQIIVNPPTNQLAITATAFPTSGSAPLAVNFDGAASGGSAPYGYTWYFGDGSSASSPNVQYTYTAPGSYAAYLYAWDSAGKSGASPPIPINVFSQPLVVFIGAFPTSGNQPLTVQFSSTVLGGSPPYTYSWDFGDGATGAGDQPVHTYFAAGTYYAHLSVHDRNGQGAASAPVQIVVQPQPSQLSVTASANPTSGTAPLTVTFSGSASGGNGQYAYLWVFGDGTTSGAQFTSHTYSTAGQYDAYLSVSDSQGATGYSTPIRIEVSPGQLVAGATAFPTRGPAPLAVRFSAGVSGGTPPFYFGWEFGDGGLSSAQYPTYTYFTAGTYRAFVIVMDSSQPAQTASSNALVIEVEKGPQNLLVSADANPRSGPAPLLVQFAAKVGGGSPPYSLDWTFGDGATGSGESPSHIYPSTGTFQAYVVVRDSQGGSGFSSPIEIQVTGGGQLAAQSFASPIAGPAPLRVDFVGLAAGGSVPYQYYWEFGDGKAGSGETAQHTYAYPGSYPATLKVTDSTGRSASAPTLMITVGQPGEFKVSASASPTSGAAPLPVDFKGSAPGAEGPSWSWSFGDGAYASEQNPRHQYNLPGNYRATLTVTNRFGQMGLATLEISVSGDSPLKVIPTPKSWYGGVGESATFDVKVVSDRLGDVTSKSVIAWTAPPFGSLDTSVGPRVKFTADSPGKGELRVSASYSGTKAAATISILVDETGPRPKVKIVTPANGSEVRGMVTISGTVQFGGAVENVLFRVDGGEWDKAVSDDGFLNWTYLPWNTSKEKDGPHRLEVRAIAVGGMYEGSHEVDVTVNNAAIPGGTGGFGLPTWWWMAALAVLAMIGSAFLAMAVRKRLRPNAANELARNDRQRAQQIDAQTGQMGAGGVAFAPVGAPPSGATYGAGFAPADESVRRRAVALAVRRRAEASGAAHQAASSSSSRLNPPYAADRRLAATELARRRSAMPSAPQTQALPKPVPTSTYRQPAPVVRAAPPSYTGRSPSPSGGRNAAIQNARTRLDRIRSERGGQ